MENHFKVAKMLAHLLDEQFKIGGFSFGLDPLLDFLPGIGDFLALLLSFYIVWIAKQANVPGNEVTVMIRNISIDFILGLIPIVGYAGDFVFKANMRNIKILEKYISSSVIEGQIVA